MKKLKVTIVGPKSDLSFVARAHPNGHTASLDETLPAPRSQPRSLYTMDGIQITIPPNVAVHISYTEARDTYLVSYTPSEETPDNSHHFSKTTDDLYTLGYPAQGRVVVTDKRTEGVVLKTTLILSLRLGCFVIPFELLTKLK